MVNHVLSHLTAVLRIEIRLRWLPVVSVILPWLEMSETHLQKAALKDEDQDDLGWVFLYIHSSISAIHPNIRCSDIFTKAIRTKAMISIVDGG